MRIIRYYTVSTEYVQYMYVLCRCATAVKRVVVDGGGWCELTIMRDDEAPILFLLINEQKCPL